mmetsp:Transcript_394/g.1438  ORF Transcript_394/g.1438 Transcript_394/m.1438 type:complete len:270 (+) Transcript_394:73-882(+)
MACPPQLHGLKIGFIGAGAMATSMIQGLLRSGVPSSALAASDPYEASRKKVSDLGVFSTTDNLAVAVKSDVLVLAVKPNVLEDVLSGLRWHVERKLLVSIAAGKKIGTIEHAMGRETRVVRTMPNTPCLVGEAAVGVAKGKYTLDGDVAIAKALFTGVCVEVAEKDLDAVTALSGSGPAYVFLFIEALADAGVKAGLTRQVALTLAAQTVKGAAAMQLQTGEHPGVLKDMVTSPAGTTIAGVEALEQHGFRFAAMSAVKAANERSKELA